MEDNIYKQLREQMDHYGLGYPAAESGIEIKLLKKLFSEEEKFFVSFSEFTSFPKLCVLIICKTQR